MDETPSRTLITTRAEYLAAVDALLPIARRRICVFDPDLALLQVRIDKAEYWDAPHHENVKISTLAAQNQAQGA